MKAMISAMTVAMAVVGGSAAFAAEPTETTATESTATESGSPETNAPQHESLGTGAEAYCYWETYCNVYGYCWTNWVCF